MSYRGSRSSWRRNLARLDRSQQIEPFLLFCGSLLKAIEICDFRHLCGFCGFQRCGGLQILS